MKRVFFLTAAATIALAACGNDAGSDTETTAEAQPSLLSAGSMDSLTVPSVFETTSFPAVTGTAFIDAFAGEPNTERQTNGSVIQTLAEGNGRSPSATDLAKINFVARVAGETTPFGSSYEDGAPVVFGMQQALVGWTDTLKTMKEGGMVRVALPPELAFGSMGMDGTVAPNAVTVYDIELIKVYGSDNDAELAQLASEMKANMNTFSLRAQEQQALAQQQFSGLAAANAARSQLFVNEQGEREATITTATGLVYEVVSDAGTGPNPKIGDTISVHYRGTLPGGEVFDSSYQRGQPAQFELGRVIAGWNEALQLMNAGDVFRLYIPSNLAYGPRGTPDGSIGPNQALVFDVELLSVQPAATPEEE